MEEEDMEMEEEEEDMVVGTEEAAVVGTEEAAIKMADETIKMGQITKLMTIAIGIVP